jgi:hypothetical protein
VSGEKCPIKSFIGQKEREKGVECPIKRFIGQKEREKVVECPIKGGYWTKGEGAR